MIAATSVRSVADVGVFRNADLVGDARDVRAGARDRQNVAALDNGLRA